MCIKKIVATTIIALLVSFVCITIQSQSTPQYKFKKAKDSKYINGTQLKKLHEYDDLFSTHPESYTHFKKFNKNRIRAKRSGFISLGLVATLPILASYPNKGIDPNGSILWAIVVTTPLAVIMGTAAIVFKLKSNGNKTKALSIFNDDITSIPLPEKSHTLSFKTNNNGIGLSLSF